MEKQYIKKDIKLEDNGRIFPNWIMHNFKNFILPEIIRKEGEDPCNEKLVNELTIYQKFIASYLDYRSPFKDLLLYHGVGSGKTLTAINIYNILYNYTPKWNIFIIIPASLRDDPWLKELSIYLQKENYEQRLKNITFVHFDSPYADRDFLDKIKKVDSSKPFLFIIDEAQKFITNVYNNITTKSGKRAQIIYDYIQQEKKENINNRILLLSGTPAVNSPFEFALIYNLLRPNTFPVSEEIFNQIYLSTANFPALNNKTKNMFQRRILGLTSYYIGATPDKYATKIVHYKNIYMNKFFQEIYEYFENIEEEKEKLQRKLSKMKINNDTSTYSSYTRQASNFIFPYINDKINGEKRPRPSNFRIKSKEALIIEETKDEEKKRLLIKSNKEIFAYISACKNFINQFIEFLKDIHREDKKNKYTIKDDILNFKNNFNSSYSNFNSSDTKKSKLYIALYQSSPKMVMIIFNILKSKGPVLVYSNYVEMEGLQILKIYLQFFGFTNFTYEDINEKINDVKNNEISTYDYFRYVEYHGGIKREQRELNKKIFNSRPNNIYGKVIKIIMISPAGAEGINLYNVRQVHILEPYWNEAKIEQIIGRAIRQCHHADLPIEERKVDVFRYKMIRYNKKETTDEKLENLSRKKNNLLLSFIEAIKESAIDCELFKTHNMMGSKYKCFQFNEESLFEDNIGPAYNVNLDFDQKINNGLNSYDSLIKKIKVRKISASYKIDNILSKPKFYWYYDKTNIIYDYELNFPIGTIQIDEYNNPIKIDNETYIIDKLINIPAFQLYN